MVDEKKISIESNSKINLNLLITGKRKDGYHNIKSVFQKISLSDTLTISKSDKFEIISNIKNVNTEDNIVYKAYIKLKELYDIPPVKVELDKRIPMEAGLGGGSADAAAFLTGINKLFSLKIPKRELIKIGRSLGADVVPLLYDGAVLAKGIGSNIKIIKSKIKFYIVIVKPKYGSNTKEMYKEYDLNKENIKELDYTDDIIKALENNNLSLLKGKLYNVFEDVYKEKESLNTIKSKLLELKSTSALLSGSGSSIYGLYNDKMDAERAYDKLKEEYDVYLCENIN